MCTTCTQPARVCTTCTTPNCGGCGCGFKVHRHAGLRGCVEDSYFCVLGLLRGRLVCLVSPFGPSCVFCLSVSVFRVCVCVSVRACIVPSVSPYLSLSLCFYVHATRMPCSVPLLSLPLSSHHFTFKVVIVECSCTFLFIMIRCCLPVVWSNDRILGCEE